MKINSIANYYKEKYGYRVFKIGLSTNIQCQKRKENDPCYFCLKNTFTDTEIDQKNISITEQIEYLIDKLKTKVKAEGYIAYFQDTAITEENQKYHTHIFTEAANHPKILELSIATRPDNISKQFLDTISTIEKPITIEIGIQTTNDKSLKYLNRGHTQTQNQNAINILKDYKYRVGIHIILGIPTDDINDVNNTIQWINDQKIIADVKIHHLAVFKGAILENIIKKEEIIDLEKYIPLLAHFIKNIRKDITISRLFTSNLNRHQSMINNFPGIKRQWINKFQKYWLLHPHHPQ